MAGISHEGQPEEQLYRELTGATKPQQPGQGDAMFGANQHVEIKAASTPTLNQVRAVKYIPLVVFHRPTRTWYVVPQPPPCDGECADEIPDAGAGVSGRSPASRGSIRPVSSEQRGLGGRLRGEANAVGRKVLQSPCSYADRFVVLIYQHETAAVVRGGDASRSTAREEVENDVARPRMHLDDTVEDP